MPASATKYSAYIHNFISGIDPACHCLLNTQIDGLHKFLRKYSIGYFVNKFVARATSQRYQPEFCMAVKVNAGCTPNVFAFGLHFLADAFQIDGSRPRGTEFQFVFARKAIGNALKVQFAHTLDNDGRTVSSYFNSHPSIITSYFV